jgi:hypothetical protein
MLNIQTTISLVNIHTCLSSKLEFVSGYKLHSRGHLQFKYFILFILTCFKSEG